MIELWDDTRLLPGADWKNEIAEAMATTRVAVLLISADFLASRFIANDELPPLLARAETEGAVIMPVIVGPSRFDRTPSLSRFQAVNPPSSPLGQMGRPAAEAVLNRLAHAIEDALRPAIEEADRVASTEPEPPAQADPVRTISNTIQELPDNERARAMDVVTRALSEMLQLKDGFAILGARRRGNRFVQFARDVGGMHGEATGHAFVEAIDPITPEEEAALTNLGWRRPDNENANFLIEWQDPVALDEVARRAVDTLWDVYGVKAADDFSVQVEHF